MKNCRQIHCMYNSGHGFLVKEYNGICPLSNMPRPGVPDTNVVKTNADHIRSMTDEELAKHNVRESTEYVFDYDWDENPVGEYVSCWRTSDESLFWNYDLAIEYELNWLKQPYKEIEAELEENKNKNG